MRRGLAIFVLLCCASIVTGGLIPTAFGADLVLSTKDGPRHVLVLTPGMGRHPTVIVLHGKGGSGAEIAADSGFAEAAAAEGFAAVFPDGLHQAWNDGRFPAGTAPDDVGFLASLVARLLADGTATKGRVYLAGISNGGLMTFTMACKAEKLFAGFATIIAAMPTPLASCAIAPTSLLMINGTADPVMPFAGGPVGLAGNQHGSVIGVEQTASLFARAAGCKGSTRLALPDPDIGDGTTVTRVSWNKCRKRGAVSLYRVEGGGHEIPGHPAADVPKYGHSNLDISAADTILAAFATAK